MFIFDKMDKVDNRAEVMLEKMRFERAWRIRAARDMESQADKISKPENWRMRTAMLDHAAKLIREAMEINDAYHKLKNVVDAVHA